MHRFRHPVTRNVGPEGPMPTGSFLTAKWSSAANPVGRPIEHREIEINCVGHVTLSHHWFIKRLMFWVLIRWVFYNLVVLFSNLLLSNVLPMIIEIKHFLVHYWFVYLLLATTS